MAMMRCCRTTLAAMLLAAAAKSPAPLCRDRLKQPFAATSIWNSPRGSDAQLEPAGIFDSRFPPPRNFHNDQVSSRSAVKLRCW
jgi:hypothetical protein